MTTTNAIKLPEYVTPAYIEALKLRHGLGSGKPGDRCALQEVRAWLQDATTDETERAALDPAKDTIPECISPVIGRMVVRLNDSRWRPQLAPILPMLIGSRGSLALERRRAFKAADWSVRTVVPFAFECAAKVLDRRGFGDRAVKMREHAKLLGELQQIVDVQTARSARDASQAARAYADAAAAADAYAYAAYAADAYAAAAAAYAAADAAAAYADAAAAAAYAAAYAAYAAAYADAAAADAYAYAAYAAYAAPNPIDLLRELLAMTEEA